MPLLDLDARPDAVPQARAWARAVLDGWGAGALRDDVDLVLSELLANAVLHAPGPVRVVLEQADDGVRVEVRDASTVAPTRRESTAAATTGRGLNLVAALSRAWGTSARDDGEAGKAVWSLVTGNGDLSVPDLDVDLLLASFDPDDAGARTEVHVGEAPVQLLRAAKDHLDGLLREIALAEESGGLPREVVEPIASAARAVAEARAQLRELLTAAAARGDQRVDIVFRLPLALADAGERYLQALGAADAFARDRRLLSLESPVEHRVLREWYVGRMVAGLRAAAGGPPVAEETFETRLLSELHRLQQRQRAAERTAQLQRATARLAAAETLEDIARVATDEGLRVLGATGGALTRTSGGDTVAVHEAGRDVGVGERYGQVRPRVRLTGPSTQALRTGVAVLVESREECAARFPGLVEVQPDVAAVAAVPLVVTGEVVGALRFSWDEPHVFSADERELLEALAAQTGQSVARAEALRRLQDLRDELDRLARTDGQVSSTDLGVLRTLYGEAPVGVAVVDGHGGCLRVNALLAPGGSTSPSASAGRSVGEVVAGPGHEAERFDALAARVFATAGPLEEEVTTGDGARTWRTSWFPVRGPDDEVEAAVVLAVEITAQRRAEARTRLLAALGDRLGQDQTQAGVLAAAADALVPELADWLTVHLRDDHGVVMCALARHADPAREPALRRSGAALWTTEQQPHGAGHVLTTGRSEWLVVDDAVLDAVAHHDPRLGRDLREVGTGVGAVVPLVAGVGVLGALSVGRNREHPLSVEDLAVLEDVGRRLGVALQGVRTLSTSVRLDIALDAADVGSYDWDVRTGRLDWDDRLYRLLDVDPLTFDGSMETFYAKLHPDDAEPVRTALDRAVAQGGELAMTYRVLLGDGAVRWVEARGHALAGPDGATERVVGVAVDVTSRQEGQQRAERVLELMGDGFLLLDDAWRLRYVNREAERLLDRRREDLLGAPVWERFPDAVGSAFQEQCEHAVAERVAVRFEQCFPAQDRLLEVRAHPGPDGLAVYLADVGDRRAAERERDRALARLAQIDAIGSALSEVLDVDEALTRLAGLLVPTLADLCTIDLKDAEGVLAPRTVVTTAEDSTKADLMLRAEQVLPRRDNPASAVHQVLAGRPLVHLVLSPQYLSGVAADPVQAQLWLDLDSRHFCVVPLSAHGRVFGAISLIRTGPGAVPFSEDDLVFAQDVGRRAGLLVGNVVQYAAQREAAEDLQRSLLPELPAVPGVELGAAYQPSSSAALVGGDWYDAFELPDGATGLVVGDVMGHDMSAAAAMGQLRSVLRTCAVDGDGPARVLARLDRLVSSFAMADLATVVYLRLLHRPDGGALLTWSNAGHPPPLLLSADGAARYLDGGRGVMIGTGLDEPRDQADEEVPPGSTVLMFTDGLVERRGRDLDAQLDEFARTAARLLGEVDTPAELCRRLLATVRSEGGTDDAAVVALRLLPASG